MAGSPSGVPLRAAVYADAPVIVRMAMHARLVQVSTDPIHRARHMALATGLEDGPSPRH